MDAFLRVHSTGLLLTEQDLCTAVPSAALDVSVTSLYTGAFPGLKANLP